MFGMDIKKFELLVDRRRGGTPLNFGWGTFPTVCSLCGEEYIVVEIVGASSDFICPTCNHVEKEHWIPGEQEMGHDGGWLEPVGWETAVPIGRN